MLNLLSTRFNQGHQTNRFPEEVPPLPDRFRGRPTLSPERCADGCRACAEACPTKALETDPSLRLDLGKCLFCTACTEACPQGAIEFKPEYRLATRTREDLTLQADQTYELAKALEDKAMKLFGRSLKLRVVSAGGCNGCEVDTNVLETIGWDLGRFGIQIVASPRHADAVVVCGPVTKNMELGLKKTLEATSDPKLVIAVGACAISGGPFASQKEQLGGAESCAPVDLYIPGCPPHPLTILDGLLRLLGRIE
jgi:Ni,Fe-hydrogenase III small subunit/NAD-dependent dihydropyrimidine dehydrogenase PreA subunit